MGGLAGSPLARMNCRTVNVHDGPPPVKVAVTVPVPVAEGAVYEFATGITGTLAEAGPVPYMFVAVTAQVYAVPFVRPLTVMGDDTPVAVTPPGLHVAV
jgi:hypothetical protein